ncbi:hypothetical protein Q3A95_05655 [Limosilactobacillus reuteri]|nr:hypothetical protein [Limosilactobacillus reuteri]WLR78737.1 hypothetical protein Q3A95_05655 [Limosilactobacillus reuteri]
MTRLVMATFLTSSKPDIILLGKKSSDGGVLEQETGKLRNQNFRLSSGTLTSEFDKPIKITESNNIRRVDRLLKK